jgi:FkbM family methyltransferase
MPTTIHRSIRFLSSFYPLLSGQGTLLQTFPLSRIRFDEDRLAITLGNGYKVCIFPNDFIGRAIYFFGDVDPKITKLLQALLDPGDSLIDVGANVGIVSFQCIPFVGPNGRVIAVEPQPACVELLQESIRLNQIANLEVHRIALSDRPGQAMLHLEDASNLGTATLNSAVTGTRGIAVEAVDGSRFLESLNLEGDYAIKLDVEGHEGPVLESMRSFLERKPPKAILFESNTYLYQHTSFFEERSYGIISSLGFRLFQIPKRFVKLRLSEIVSPEGEPEATDFLALRHDLSERLSRFY